MNSTFSLLLVFPARFFMPRHNAQMRLLKAQIHILRARIPAQRIILSPAEKSELLRIGAEIGHDIDGLMEVAKPETYKRWLAQTRSGRPFKAVGRLPAGRGGAGDGIDKVVSAHLLEPAIIRAVAADEDRVHRRLHVVVDPTRTGAAEEGKGLVMGIEHHFLRLSRVRPADLRNRLHNQHPTLCPPIASEAS